MLIFLQATADLEGTKASLRELEAGQQRLVVLTGELEAGHHRLAALTAELEQMRESRLEGEARLKELQLKLDNQEKQQVSITFSCLQCVGSGTGTICRIRIRNKIFD